MKAAPDKLRAVTWDSMQTLTHRFDDLVMLIADLRAGYPVDATRIQHLLTRIEWRRFQLLVHGPGLPVTPSPEMMGHVYHYLALLKVADEMLKKARAKKRSKSFFFGPEAFREAEAAYDRALERLDQTVNEHPIVVHYLSPLPAWKLRGYGSGLSEKGVPRVGKFIDRLLVYVYSRKESESKALRAAEFVEGIARHELARWDWINERLGTDPPH